MTVSESSVLSLSVKVFLRYSFKYGPFEILSLNYILLDCNRFVESNSTGTRHCVQKYILRSGLKQSKLSLPKNYVTANEVK